MHEITDAVTQWIADYGLYAIFFLSVVDAVLPAASELVMVYGGALAAGAFAGQTVTLFGEPIESTFWAWFAVFVAGTVGYVLGSIGGWAIGLYGGRPYLERHGRWLHVTPAKLDQAEHWFEHYGAITVCGSRMLPVVRSFISIPAGIAEMPLGRYTVLTTAREHPLVRGPRRDRRGRRRELGGVPPRLPLRGHRRAHARRRGRDLRALAPPATAAEAAGVGKLNVDSIPWGCRSST